MSECEITVVPGGPALVRGAGFVRDEDGNRHEVGRAVVAVCLCGLTQRAPWCDSTHKVAGD
ncbi:CDGSH iron-sulfur domain-containing protein [Nocardioides humilatus]|uniref:CDGSH iron-sulfur domain-containing protein n=1 Tax=Nocardioides humilatus TaxID=2607660 RepID=A0A5B1L9G9_9ACTN|nr:CDGSH iron-sulfur domain-containing protein [Nocardioides humilatus]KAA1416934.1 CDGSH iron-sulfur domain-containing protein [Nocardioides humilatus]